MIHGAYEYIRVGHNSITTSQVRIHKPRVKVSAIFNPYQKMMTHQQFQNMIY